jgi:secretion/DNA translocation related TadE-like protein
MNERERGAGTVLALALALVVVLSCAAGVLVVEGLAAAAKAARAADLAALVAADVERGLRPGQACSAAGTVAQLNEATLVSCEIENPGERVRVTTRVPMSSGWGSAERRARAGRPP